jgi:hypothetical protein
MVMLRLQRMVVMPSMSLSALRSHRRKTYKAAQPARLLPIS